MPVVATHQLSPADISGPDSQQLYNALDCCVTMEVWEELQTLFNSPPDIYAFERALQAPALEMMLRGFLVDRVALDKAVVLLEARLIRLEAVLDRLARAVWSKPINARSTQQLLAFFYQSMHIPEIQTSKKGTPGLHMDREVLEKLETYFYARPIVATILAIRDTAKAAADLRSGIDQDGRMRTSINVGATETGRFSSSKNTTGGGRNMFNVTDDQRHIFIADPGWKLGAIDLEQAESREVGFLCGTLFGDWSYLDACEAGDLHTTVARMVWPELAWTGESKADRVIADQLFYRNYSYRYMAKRGGHGSNYLLTPWTAARELKCPLKTMEEFHTRYFTAFPCIAKWHQWIAEQLQTTQQLTTVFGRNRRFFGRPGDDTTLREAVAYGPQGATADRLNIGLLRIWQQMGKRVKVMLQLYDAVYFQYRVEEEAEVLSQALALMDVPLVHKGRVFTVPGEVKTGWNWGDYVSEEDIAKAIAKGQKPPLLNVDGLRKWKGGDDRTRTVVLDKVM